MMKGGRLKKSAFRFRAICFPENRYILNTLKTQERER